MIDVLTVLICDDPAGCAEQALALQVHAAHERYEVVGFDDVVADALMGEHALRRWEAAVAELRRSPTPEAQEEARAALEALPFTVSAEELLLVRPDAASGGTASLSVTSDRDARVFVDGVAAGAAPLAVEVAAGWHRVTVERPGRRTAWVGTFVVSDGQEAHVAADLAMDDAEAAVRMGVIGAMHGQPPADDVTAALSAWAKAEGVEWVRFVSLEPAGEDAGPTGVPTLDGRGPGYTVTAAFLDVSGERFATEGPAPRDRAVPLHVGVGSGYVRLGSRDHLLVEGVVTVPMSGRLALDLRAGAARSAEPYLLYEDGQDFLVVPASLGLRYGRTDGGLYGGVAALAVVPYAVGASGTVGYELRANRWLRAGVELRGIVTDRDLGGGAVVTLSARP
jgi:hypothetical protein